MLEPHRVKEAALRKRVFVGEEEQRTVSSTVPGLKMYRGIFGLMKEQEEDFAKIRRCSRILRSEMILRSSAASVCCICGSG